MRTKATRLKAAVLIFLLSAFGSTASGQLEVIITNADIRPFPIAVVPFGWEGAGPAPFDLAGLVATDLSNSGRFEPIPNENMLTQPTSPSRRAASWVK